MTGKAKNLASQFESRVADLLAEGLVDFKAKVDVDGSTNPSDLVKTHSNLLRLRAENKRELIYKI